MLILTRKEGEVVKIGDDIEVRVLSRNGNQIRLGITAPKDMRVDRLEVRERIEAEKRGVA